MKKLLEEGNRTKIKSIKNCIHYISHLKALPPPPKKKKIYNQMNL